MKTEALLKTELPEVTLLNRGKVRDLYDIGNLLMVASDRISAYDVVMGNGIPHKGRVLTGITEFWLREVLNDIIPNHLISTSMADLPEELYGHEELEGRIMICEKLQVVPIECIARRNLTGSGWKSYQEDGTVCKIQLPGGILECGELPYTLFTPSTKAEQGHDENISFEEGMVILKEKFPHLDGRKLMQDLQDATIAIFDKARDFAKERGIIIADTKFEFGIRENGQLVLIDEVLTPDSSRFWLTDKYEEGRDQDSLDKQFVRNYLTEEGLMAQPGVILPDEIVRQTTVRYTKVHKMLTGKTLVA